ncbi:MAG: hypothetical protein M1823_003487 [Watsoniomyces obsoletus]|nr:MAG: hypothetical protein M1823_003487 [Watsoniomyces obsoletus]
MSSTSSQPGTTPSAQYTSPQFPSLYWPINAQAGEAVYLYYYGDIWRFTLFWTLIVYGAVYLSASAYALAMQTQNWKSAWVIPLVFGVVGGLEAMLAGSVIGLILGAIYDAGFFKMSTWIPFVWALINVLTIILSSFSIQGAL